jgi:hypothetical protein
MENRPMPTATRERPIIFSGPMVRAILAGAKTQTRRLIKPQPGPDIDPDRLRSCRPMRRELYTFLGNPDLNPPCEISIRPRWFVGDRLWVREAFVIGYDVDDSGYLVMTDKDGDELPEKAWYRATESDGFTWMTDEGWRTERIPWKSAIHMPRWASRITLEITGVKVERLQALNEWDAFSEGAPACEGSHVAAFAGIWESIHGPGSWAANPWVWVLTFSRLAAGPVA